MHVDHLPEQSSAANCTQTPYHAVSAPRICLPPVRISFNAPRHTMHTQGERPYLAPGARAEAGACGGALLRGGRRAGARLPALARCALPVCGRLSAARACCQGLSTCTADGPYSFLKMLSAPCRCCCAQKQRSLLVIITDKPTVPPPKDRCYLCAFVLSPRIVPAGTSSPRTCCWTPRATSSSPTLASPASCPRTASMAPHTAVMHVGHACGALLPAAAHPACAVLTAVCAALLVCSAACLAVYACSHMHAERSCDITMYQNALDSAASAPYARSFTVCGTTDYMAPETIRGIGSGYSADWCASCVLRICPRVQ